MNWPDISGSHDLVGPSLPAGGAAVVVYWAGGGNTVVDIYTVSTQRYVISSNAVLFNVTSLVWFVLSLFYFRWEFRESADTERR